MRFAVFRTRGIRAANLSEAFWIGDEWGSWAYLGAPGGPITLICANRLWQCWQRKPPPVSAKRPSSDDHGCCTSIGSAGTLAVKGTTWGETFGPIGLSTPILSVAPEGSDIETVCDIAGGEHCYNGKDVEGWPNTLRRRAVGQHHRFARPRDPARPISQNRWIVACATSLKSQPV